MCSEKEHLPRFQILFLSSAHRLTHSAFIIHPSFHQRDNARHSPVSAKDPQDSQVQSSAQKVLQQRWYFSEPLVARRTLTLTLTLTLALTLTLTLALALTLSLTLTLTLNPNRNPKP